MPDTILASTAHWTAAVRALESARLDHLFSDPWAAALAGEQGQSWLSQRHPDSVIPIILRTRYFDDVLQRVAREDGMRQIVLLAAGLDTRAFRLPWPVHTRLFEIDQPGVLAHKSGVLSSAGAQPSCERIEIGADLRMTWQDRLMAAGFDAQQPSAWLLEGFLFYIPSEDVMGLLKDVSRLAAPGSWLGFDIINSITLTFPFTKAWVDMQAQSGAPWIGVIDDPISFLAPLGWQASLTQAGQLEANHGRWKLPVLPPDMPNVPHNWFVTARKEA
jgi:methyltransferase (TIGR00027 family)